MPPTDPMTPQRLREIGYKIDIAHSDTKLLFADPEIGAELRAHANQLERHAAWRDPEAMARQFHETYERLAPQFGYETRKESAHPWESVPEKNRKLMIAVCEAILAAQLERNAEMSIHPHKASNLLKLFRGEPTGEIGDGMAELLPQSLPQYEPESVTEMRGANAGYALCLSADRMGEIVAYVDSLRKRLSISKDWQSISTAPKNGTTLLILDAFYYRTDKSKTPHYVLRSAFFNDNGEWEECESGEILDDDGPAYWMPLPKPPEAK